MISSRYDARLFRILAKDISTELPTGGGNADEMGLFLSRLVRMAEMTIKNLSHSMAKINFAMLATCTDVGALAAPDELQRRS